jgi:hypothetical protein
MDFALFIVVNAILFVRPSEFVPALLGMPLYEVSILCCFAASFPKVLEQFTGGLLARRPVAVCVLGLLPAVVLSHLSHFYFGGAYEAANEFAKVLLFFLLFVGIVNTPERLRQYVGWLVVFVTVVCAIALLQYYDVIDLPTLRITQESAYDEETGEDLLQKRLCYTGIFNNPNDLSRILAVALPFCLWLLTSPEAGVARLVWLFPLGACGWSIYLTNSRGGLLGLIAGLVALFHHRFGTARTLLVGALVLPGVLAAVLFRQTESAAKISTSQQRIQLWSEGLAMFREAPLFGTGVDTYQDRAGLVAHNSYIHAFAELGLLGGVLFLGAWAVALWEVYRLAPPHAILIDPGQRRLQPFLLAAVVAYVVGMLSISRDYQLGTYVLLGLVTAFLAHDDAFPRRAPLRFNAALVGRLLMLGLAFLAAAYVFVRLFVRWQ